MLDPVTGKGKTGPDWSVGAQAVEIEVDKKAFTYRILTASTVMDVGKVINPELMRAMVAGGMSMGISLASREAFTYDQSGVPQAANLHTYKLLHIGQEPIYQVDFVQRRRRVSLRRPEASRTRIIGISAALANALSLLFGLEVTQFRCYPKSCGDFAQGGKMIPSDFIYYRPIRFLRRIRFIRSLARRGFIPRLYGGGIKSSRRRAPG
jgi:CO/xanthine dehydrogenase Mo-binding subunit